MIDGIAYIQKPENMARMRHDLPVLFIAGGEDHVGGYGKGVEHVAADFVKAGMVRVTTRICPGCRHEILNELNKQEVYEDISRWLAPYVGE